MRNFFSATNAAINGRAEVEKLKEIDEAVQGLSLCMRMKNWVFVNPNPKEEEEWHSHL